MRSERQRAVGVLIAHVELAPCVDEQLYNLRVALSYCKHYGASSVRISRLNIGAPFEQKLNRKRFAKPARRQQRRQRLFSRRTAVKESPGLEKRGLGLQLGRHGIHIFVENGSPKDKLFGPFRHCRNRNRKRKKKRNGAGLAPNSSRRKVAGQALYSSFSLLHRCSFHSRFICCAHMDAS